MGAEDPEVSRLAWLLGTDDEDVQAAKVEALIRAQQASTVILVVSYQPGTGAATVMQVAGERGDHPFDAIRAAARVMGFMLDGRPQ